MTTSFVGMEDNYKTGTISLDVSINKEVKVTPSRLNHPFISVATYIECNQTFSLAMKSIIILIFL